MAESNPINVMAAFEILLEEIEAEIAAVSEAGAAAFARRNFTAAQDAVERAEQITDLRGRLAALRERDRHRRLLQLHPRGKSPG